MLMLIFQLFFSCSVFAQPVIISPLPIVLRPAPIVLKPQYRHLKFIAAGRNSDGNYSMTHLLKTETVKPELNDINLSRMQNLLSDIKVNGENFNTALVQELIFGVAGIQGMDIDALIQLVMMETAKDANADLRSLMEEMQKNRQEKAAMRENMQAAKQKLAGCRQENCPRIEMMALQMRIKRAQASIDSMSEMNEMQVLRLQALMDRMSKTATILANILKKMSETSAQIIANIK